MSVKYKHVDPSAPRMDPQIAMGTCLKPISTSLSLVIPTPFIHPVRPPVPRRNNPACDCWFMCPSTAITQCMVFLQHRCAAVHATMYERCAYVERLHVTELYFKKMTPCVLCRAGGWWLVLWCWYPGQNIGHDNHAASASASADAFSCSVCQDFLHSFFNL